ncbi:MAG: hypothetical protein H0V70_16480 [Ktedonobacteraceae bacterium]|nr:hypothetical protein [Ktedonobacteraceae bacterium]
MAGESINEYEPLEDEKLCLQCKKIRPLADFSQYKGKATDHRKICRECEQFKQYERHCRVIAQRETWQTQERAERRHQSWQRSVTLRQMHEERWREREHWYLQQPERRCRACQQIFPASAFGGSTTPAGFMLHVHCKACHAALLERRMPVCCLCQKRVVHRNFLATFNGYILCGDGIAFSLCCEDCAMAFHKLSSAQQDIYIHACCQRTFPMGQVIYAEVDPLTDEIRYVGRTGRPERRHAQHLCDRSAIAGQWGAQKTACYTRRNWMQALVEQGLQPSMQILYHVGISPLVLEWEQRFIWHGMQQGWRLLNWETMDENLVARVRTAHYNFLQTPFELLVEQHFFAANDLVAFLHTRYQQVVNTLPGGLALQRKHRDALT